MNKLYKILQKNLLKVENEIDSLLKVDRFNDCGKNSIRKKST